MELLQLRDFRAVVETGSINGAAKKLGLTQPPVSMQIRLLEQELGCKLFERGSRKIRLTEEGRTLYEHAVRILNMAESAAAAVTDCHTAAGGTLRIGVVSSLAELAAHRWFTGFAQEHPQVNYELAEGSTYDILEKLKNREIDVGLVRQPFSARGVDTVSLEPEDLLAIGTERYLAALPEKVTLKQLAELPLILYRRWLEVLDRAFAAKGYQPRVLCVADDARTCVSWAGAGLGVAVAPMDICHSPLPEGLCLRAIRGLAPMAQTTLAVNEGGCDTAAGRAFVAYFRQNCGL